MGTVKQSLLATVSTRATFVTGALVKAAALMSAAAWVSAAAAVGTAASASAAARLTAIAPVAAAAVSTAAPANVAAPATAAAPADDNDPAARASRWQALQKALFPGRSMQDGAGIVKLDAPPRALDAALVPITVDLSTVKPIKGVYVVIDNNPSPLAAHFTFGPKADPRTLKMRVRVDAYTDMHAIAESQDGHLFVATRYVKASGGCSAPAGPDDSAALADIGRMKLHLIGDFVAGKPGQAVLMVRHPNFNGMQMNQITRYYTPPRFIRTIDTSYEGAPIFHLDSDISMSTDPVITFGFVPKAKGQLKVVVKDSKDATFDHSFDIPGNDPASGNAAAGGSPGA